MKKLISFSGIQTWLGNLPLTSMISALDRSHSQAQRHKCTNSARLLGDANAPAEMGTGDTMLLVSMLMHFREHLNGFLEILWIIIRKGDQNKDHP